MDGIKWDWFDQGEEVQIKTSPGSSQKQSGMNLVTNQEVESSYIDKFPLKEKCKVLEKII